MTIEQITNGRTTTLIFAKEPSPDSLKPFKSAVAYALETDSTYTKYLLLIHGEGADGVPSVRRMYKP